LVVAVIVLFIGVSIPSTGSVMELSSTASFDGKILYVGGSGEGNYTKIQDAIDNASDGDTVFVYKGIYIENLVVNKSIRLLGEDRNSTIINNDKKGNVMHILVDGVTITEFTLQNSSNEFNFAGIKITSNYNIISNNIILNNSGWPHIKSDGIILEGSSYNNISGNTIFHNWDGIWLYYSNHNIVTGNIIFNNIHGIELSNSYYNIISGNFFPNNDNNNILIEKECDNCVIVNNTMSESCEAIGSLWPSNNITIIGNEIKNSSKAVWIKGNYWNVSHNKIIECSTGISLYSGSFTTISHNKISKCTFGVSHDEGSNNNFSYNILSENKKGVSISNTGKQNHVFYNEFRDNEEGIFASLSTDNVKIKYNNFINNKKHIIFSQFLPFRFHRFLNPIFDSNFYDDWKGRGPEVLVGTSILFVFPIFFPDLFFFLIPISIPWLYFDWHPAQEPYNIEV